MGKPSKPKKRLKIDGKNYAYRGAHSVHGGGTRNAETQKKKLKKKGHKVRVVTRSTGGGDYEYRVYSRKETRKR